MALLGPILAALGPWIMRFFAAKAVIMVAGFLGRLGLVIATNEFAVQPLIDHAVSAWNTIPAQWQCWFGLFGITKAAGIMVSALTLISAKKVFFAKG
ncbi:DUF2523 family protein [Xanthomonas sp. XNM01]|uniref:DUF2523 family protein n=1 Tax=Xanthomonas sp. XNM01 TaxID=2769289 RepID=UPI001782EF26|nr:DUF2523 family protein [Xanthomonas sp. XNM01]MBD9368380.1 DUF2523 domain-containing protein [Xanthomonas sp. XNM01]